jgi:hypothetical protein
MKHISWHGLPRFILKFQIYEFHILNYHAIIKFPLHYFFLHELEVGSLYINVFQSMETNFHWTLFP